jgi:hypothetical protein
MTDLDKKIIEVLKDNLIDNDTRIILSINLTKFYEKKSINGEVLECIDSLYKVLLNYRKSIKDINNR